MCIQCICCFLCFLADDEVIVVKAASIPGQNYIGRLKAVNLKECLHACQIYPGCFSIKYSENSTMCDLSNANYSNKRLKPNDKSWDMFFLNPGQWCFHFISYTSMYIYIYVYMCAKQPMRIFM